MASKEKDETDAESSSESEIEPALELLEPPAQTSKTKSSKRSNSTKSVPKKKAKTLGEPEKEVVFDVSQTLNSGLTYRHTIGKSHYYHSFLYNKCSFSCGVKVFDKYYRFKHPVLFKQFIKLNKNIFLYITKDYAYNL